MCLLNDLPFCDETSNIWQMLGLIIIPVKIIIPLLLIILGMIEFGKAIMSNEEKAINKAITSLAKKLISSVIIFFIPSIINTIFNALYLVDLGTDAKTCMDCLTKPNDDDCKSAQIHALGTK